MKKFIIICIALLFLVSCGQTSSETEKPEKKPEICYELVSSDSFIKHYSWPADAFEGYYEIRNTGDSDIYLKDCSVELQDDDGKLLGVDSASAYPYIVQPGESGYFYFHFSLEDVDTSNGLKAVESYSVEPVKIKYDRYELSDINFNKGKLVCRTNATDIMANIYAIFYDSSGKVIGLGKTLKTLDNAIEVEFLNPLFNAEWSDVVSCDFIALQMFYIQ